MLRRIKFLLTPVAEQSHQSDIPRQPQSQYSGDGPLYGSVIQFAPCPGILPGWTHR